MARIATTGAQVGNAARGAATQAAHEFAPWIVRLARVGYAAKGAIYLVIGALAVRAAAGVGGATTDSRGALRTIAGGTLGSTLLAVIGVGLLGYALWRLVEAVIDTEGHGRDAKGITLRVFAALRGLLYGALGVEALRLMSGSGSNGSGDGAQHWSGRVLALPFGAVLLALVALGLLGYAGRQFVRAASREKVAKRLDLAAAGEKADWIVKLGRIGIAARAVVLTMIGVLVGRAALQHDAAEAGGVGESLAALARSDAGPLVLGLVALGLMAYGVYQIATARYRRIGHPA